MILGLFLLISTGCQVDETVKDVPVLRVAAAVSLQEALQEIKSIYEKEKTIEIQFQFGGSGTLARQIGQGLEVDVFLSADEDWLELLKSNEKILEGSERPVIHNQLVFIAKKDILIEHNDNSEVEWKSLGQIALGNPKTVPAGKYAKQALTELGVWKQIEDQVILAKDVRQVITYVETGNIDAGFVYASDVAFSDHLQIVPIDSELHQDIVYPGAVINNSKSIDSATKFIDFLQSDVAQEIFRSYGFTVEGEKR